MFLRKVELKSGAFMELFCGSAGGAFGELNFAVLSLEKFYIGVSKNCATSSIFVFYPLYEINTTDRRFSQHCRKNFMELKQMEEYRMAQSEVEQKKGKSVS